MRTRRRLDWLLVALALAGLAVPAAARDASSLGTLSLPVSRVQDWWVFAPPDTAGWGSIDVTSESQMGALGCPPASAVAGESDEAALQCAIDRAPANTRLLLPAGTYDVPNGLVIRRGGLVLVGAGIDHTVIELEHEQGVYVAGCGIHGYVKICGAEQGITSHAWTGGYARGNTVLALADVSGLAPEDWVVTREANDPSLYLGQNRDHTLTYVARVASVDAGARTITLDRPLRHDYGRPTSSGRVVEEFTPIEHVGLEALTLRRTTLGSNAWSPHIHFQFATHFWVRGVKIEHGLKVGVSFERMSARGLLAESWIHDFDDPETYGHDTINFRDGAHDHAVVNNLVTEARGGVVLQMGTSGNAILYNAFLERSQGCWFRHIFGHGDYQRANLLEGNHVECRIEFDNYYGPQGPWNTLYRNRQSGDCTGTDPAGSCGVDGNDHHAINNHNDANAPTLTESFNVLANVAPDFFGRPACGSKPPSACPDYDLASVDLWMERNLARGVITLESPEAGTRLVSNAENARGSGRRPTTPDWEAFCAGAPDSLVYPSIPEWWCRESADCWSVETGIGACGDDLGSSECLLPAQRRAVGLECTPLGAGVCGDGEVTAGEVCDASAPSSGCSAPASFCDDCSGCAECLLDADCPVAGDVCLAGSCRTPECSVGNDAACSDGNLCNGAESCSAPGFCQAGAPPECGGSTQCLQASCDPLLGCLTQPRPDGTGCDDGSSATRDDRCVAGVCVGTPKKGSGGGGQAVCGDGRCDSSESPKSCPADCKKR
jgi:hypothetical protein